MKEILDNWKEYTELLQESSLSRVHKHIMEHDCIILSAYRSDPLDRSKCTPESVDSSNISSDETGRKRSKKEINRMRSAELKAILLDESFQVTEIIGSYIENFTKPEAVEVKEKSLFVVNVGDQSNFLNRLTMLGKRYCQDSILFIPAGGKGAFLLGTNNSEFPGLGNRIDVGDFKGGKEAEFMSRIGDRPFTFGEQGDREIQLESFSSLSRMERMAVRAIAKKARSE